MRSRRHARSRGWSAWSNRRQAISARQLPALVVAELLEHSGHERRAPAALLAAIRRGLGSGEYLPNARLADWDAVIEDGPRPGKLDWTVRIRVSG